MVSFKVRNLRMLFTGAGSSQVTPQFHGGILQQNGPKRSRFLLKRMISYDPSLVGEISNSLFVTGATVFTITNSCAWMSAYKQTSKEIAEFKKNATPLDYKLHQVQTLISSLEMSSLKFKYMYYVDIFALLSSTYGNYTTWFAFLILRSLRLGADFQQNQEALTSRFLAQVGSDVKTLYISREVDINQLQLMFSSTGVGVGDQSADLGSNANVGGYGSVARRR